MTTESPDTGTTVQSWDEAGNRVFRSDAEDQALSFFYDELNRLTPVTYPSPGNNILYAYDGGTDGMGRMTGMTDPSGATGFMYDARGRLVEKTLTREGESLTLSRQFTLAGRQSSLTYPSGRVLNFERRDCACGVDGIFTHVGATEPVTLMDNLVYRPFGGATASNTGSDDTIANQHDADGRLRVPSVKFKRIMPI